MQRIRSIDPKHAQGRAKELLTSVEKAFGGKLLLEHTHGALERAIDTYLHSELLALDSAFGGPPRSNPRRVADRPGNANGGPACAGRLFTDRAPPGRRRLCRGSAAGSGSA